MDDIKSQLEEQISSETGAAETVEVARGRPSLIGRVPRARIGAFVREFGTLVSAGFPVVRALDVLTHNTRNARMAATLRAIRESIDSGVAVYRALGDHPWYFDAVVVNIIRSAEEAGKLGEGLEYVADMLEEETAIRSRLGNALAYPFVLMSLSFFVVLLMLFFVVPQFTSVIEQSGGELDGMAATVGKLSAFITHPAGFVLMVILIAGPFIGLLTFRQMQRLRFDTFLGSLPIVGRLMMLAELTRLSNMIKLMTQNGVPIRSALSLAQGAVNNTYVRNAVAAMGASAEQGKSLAEPLENYSALPYFFPEMIAVGEESGKLTEMLDHLSRVMTRKFEDSVERLPVVLQPLLLIFIGGVVVAIFMMYFFPYFDLLTSLSQSQ